MNFVSTRFASVRSNGPSSRRAQAFPAPGLMPKRIFLRLFLSALAAMLAVHFWKHGGRP